MVCVNPELGSPMPGEAWADDPAGGDVEGGKQRRRAVPFVVMAAPLGLAGPHGQRRLGAAERLDLAFLANAQHQRTLGRGHVKANNVAHFRDEVPRKCCAFRWVGRELERFYPVRLQAERAPDALNRRDRQAAGAPCRANSSACRPLAGFPACGRSPPRPAHLRPCGARLAVAHRASPPSDARQSGATICAPWPDARRAALRSAGNCRPHWPPDPAPSGAGPPRSPTQHAPRPSRPTLANGGCPCRCSIKIGAVWHQAAIRIK